MGEQGLRYEAEQGNTRLTRLSTCAKRLHKAPRGAEEAAAGAADVDGSKPGAHQQRKNKNTTQQKTQKIHAPEFTQFGGKLTISHAVWGQTHAKLTLVSFDIAFASEPQTSLQHTKITP